MAKGLVEQSSLTAIADAIRAKGVEGNWKPAEMAGAIANIPAGGGNLDVKYYTAISATTAIMPDDFNENSTILFGGTVFRQGKYFASVYFGYFAILFYLISVNWSTPSNFLDPMSTVITPGIFTDQGLSSSSSNSFNSLFPIRIDSNTPPAKSLNFFLRNGIDYDSTSHKLIGLVNTSGSPFRPTWATNGLASNYLYMMYI